MKGVIKKINDNKLYLLGKRFHNDPSFIATNAFTQAEMAKNPKRYDVINFLSKEIKAQSYLEIGVRNPADNFDLINIEKKYSVDPGLEFEPNPVDFQMTSDDFFAGLIENKLSIQNDIRFDIIFIDGLHLAYQVDQDIANAVKYLADDGFIVLHDCNPPTEHHARETYNFINGPADGYWNGTTWKAFVKSRTQYYSCCIDSDWGVGIISKKNRRPFNILEHNANPYFDFCIFNDKRIEQLNLVSFEKFTGNFG